jgi:hypothetical protein
MKTGILFNDFTKNDKNYHLIKTMNANVLNKSDELCAFILNVSQKVIKTEFAYANISDIAHFNSGLLIATSLDTADAMLKTSVNSKKCLYLWNMEWLGQRTVYKGVKKLLSDDRIKIICRSQLQADIIKNNYNVDIDGIEEDFNLENIHAICEAV